MEPIAKTVTNKIVVPVRMTNNFRFSREHGSCHQKTTGFWGPLQAVRAIALNNEMFVLFHFEWFHPRPPRVSAEGSSIKTVANIDAARKAPCV
jgi:hypothetical protein